MIQHIKEFHPGFALPTVLISSVVMIIVLTTAMQTAVSTRTALTAQYYDKLTQEASESGNLKARACIEVNGGVPGWTNAAPLRPSTDCFGNAVSGQSRYVFEDSANKLRTTFNVPRPSIDGNGNVGNIGATGRLEILRKSNGLPWKTTDSKYISTVIEPYLDDSLPVGTSSSGFWTTPPAGYLLEDGRAVSRTAYPALFALIGTTYGAGNGSTTFNLPDSRGRVSVNRNTSDAEFATLGQKFGAKTHTLSIAEMASHSHAQYVCANNGSPGIRRDYRADGVGWGGYPQGVPTGPTGGGGAHNNIQPSIVETSAIKFSASTASVSKIPAGTSISGYWGTAPAGYLAEDGAAVSRTTYSSLYSSVGTTYGAGNGSTTFNLPDSRGRVSVNRNTSDAEFATLGQKYGAKTHTLSVAELPLHDHTQRVTHGTGGPAVRSDYNTDGACGAYPQGLNTGNEGGNGAHNNIQPSIVKMSAIKQTAANDVYNEVSDVKTGTSVIGYGSTVPSGYLAEDGAAVSRTTYAALFSVIGTTYGAGNGSTTFNLPDSRGRVSVNQSTDTEFNTLGKKSGAKTHTLSIAEMPSHSHAQVVVHSNAAGTATRRDYASDTAGQIYDQGLTVGGAGGNAAHNNIQPSIVVLSRIKI